MSPRRCRFGFFIETPPAAEGALDLADVASVTGSTRGVADMIPLNTLRWERPSVGLRFVPIRA